MRATLVLFFLLEMFRAGLAKAQGAAVLEKGLAQELKVELLKTHIGPQVLEVSVGLFFAPKKNKGLEDFGDFNFPRPLQQHLMNQGLNLETARVLVSLKTKPSEESRRQVAILVGEFFGGFPATLHFSEKPQGETREQSNLAREAARTQDTGRDYGFLIAFWMSVFGLLFVGWRKRSSQGGRRVSQTMEQKVAESLMSPGELGPDKEMEIALSEPGVMPDLNARGLGAQQETRLQDTPVRVDLVQTGSLGQVLKQSRRREFLQFCVLKPRRVQDVFALYGVDKLSIPRALYKDCSPTEKAALVRVFGKSVKPALLSKPAELSQGALVRELSNVVDDLRMEDLLASSRWKERASAELVQHLCQMSVSELARRVQDLGDPLVASLLEDVLSVESYRALCEELDNGFGVQLKSETSVTEVLGVRMLLQLVRPARRPIAQKVPREKAPTQEEQVARILSEIQQKTIDEEFKYWRELSLNQPLKEAVLKVYLPLPELGNLKKSLLRSWFAGMSAEDLAIVWMSVAGRLLQVQSELHDYLLMQGKKAQVIEEAIRLRKYAERKDDLRYAERLRETLRSFHRQLKETRARPNA